MSGGGGELEREVNGGDEELEREVSDGGEVSDGDGEMKMRKCVREVSDGEGKKME